MACRFGTAPSWPSTPPWSTSPATDGRTMALTHARALRSVTPPAAYAGIPTRTRPVPSVPPRRLVAAGPLKPRPVAQAAWVLLAAQRALAATLLEMPMDTEPCADGPSPALHEQGSWRGRAPRSVVGEIPDRHVEVHRGEGDVAADTGSGLLAGPRNVLLQGQRARGKNTRRCTGGQGSSRLWRGVKPHEPKWCRNY